MTLSVVVRWKLSEQSALITSMVAPHIEKVARAFGGAADGQTIPTLLTQYNRSNGRSAYRAKVRASKPKIITKDARCQGCGAKLAAPQRLYSDDCLPEARAESIDTFELTGRPAALAAARARGDDPAHGGEAGQKRSATQRERAAARLAWEQEHEGKSFDPEVFRRDVLPSLQAVSLSAMVQATELGLWYSSEIRRGLKVPHPM